jgi:SAM-dependent methyltransferase
MAYAVHNSGGQRIVTPVGEVPVVKKLKVDDADFWRHRINTAFALGKPPWFAVYETDEGTWQKIHGESIGLLQRHVTPQMKVLDAGCGIGSVYEVLRDAGLADSIYYEGVDISPDFVEIAEVRNPDATFRRGDLRAMPFYSNGEFDVAIVRSVRGMIRDQIDDRYWNAIEREVKRVSVSQLIVDYGELLGR